MWSFFRCGLRSEGVSRPTNAGHVDSSGISIVTLAFELNASASANPQVSHRVRVVRLVCIYSVLVFCTVRSSPTTLTVQVYLIFAMRWARAQIVRNRRAEVWVLWRHVVPLGEGESAARWRWRTGNRCDALMQQEVMLCAPGSSHLFHTPVVAQCRGSTKIRRWRQSLRLSETHCLLLFRLLSGCIFRPTACLVQISTKTSHKTVRWKYWRYFRFKIETSTGSDFHKILPWIFGFTSILWYVFQIIFLCQSASARRHENLHSLFH